MSKICLPYKRDFVYSLKGTGASNGAGTCLELVQLANLLVTLHHCIHLYMSPTHTSTAIHTSATSKTH